MADKPDTEPAKETTIAVSDTAHAPFVFYEMAPAFGFTNGVVNITLSANCSLVGPDGIVQAALNLRQAIDKALLLAAPTGTGKAN